jgi:hypothetical protein
MSPQRTLEGLVLCWVGAHRFAVPANGVGSIADVGQEAPWRGLLLGDACVAVDRLDIFAQPCPVYATPELCGPGAGLEGFVLAQGELWPLVTVPGLYRYLSEAR